MSYLPLSQASHTDDFRRTILVATDMDGTLTLRGKFTAASLQALEDLAAAGIQVLIVTGRSAGWVSGLSSLMPVAGAISENGGLFHPSTGAAPIFLTSIPNLISHRQQLTQTFQKLQAEFPQIQESSDNRFRITDWTFDVQGLNPSQLQTLAERCQQLGWGFTYSNVQCHIKPLQQDKADGLLQVLSKYFSHYTLKQVVTVGDSPNDQTLFDERYFPLSVGVANVMEYTNQLKHHPAYITATAEGAGFCELAQYLLANLISG